MKNFIRALRFSYPYRWRVAASVGAAFVAALLWSLNFTAIYPTLKILGSDQNLQEWINTSIKKSQEQIEPLQNRIDELTQQEQDLEKAPDVKDRERRQRHLTAELSKVESKLQVHRTELYRFQVAKRYADSWLPTDRFQTLALVVAMIVVAFVLKGIFEFIQEAMVGNVVNRSLNDMRNLFFRKVLHLDVSYFNQSGTSELMSRFTYDLESIGQGTRLLFGRIVAEPLRAIACVAVACWISWQLTFLFLVLVPVALYVLTRVARTMKRATRRQLERMSAIYKILQETFLAIKVVKAFTQEKAERRRFQEATNEYYQRAMWVVYLDAFAGPIVEVLGAAGIGIALLAGAYLVLNHETHIFGLRMCYQPLETESLLTLYGLLAAISDPVRKLSNVFNKIQGSAAAADRVFQVMDREQKVTNNSSGPMLKRHYKDIIFREVCFSYEPGQPILSHVDLNVKFGETIALVGKNGCGKSTLIGLLARFYDPDHGKVLVDGLDLRQANLRSLRQQLGIVTQDAMLFDDTMFNNIAYGKKSATQEEVEAAARHAQAHDFIMALPAGYQTKAGEAGTKLSGGQKQRITLARAILRDPAILILDEFTSQTDVETEAEVHRVLRSFMKNRTTFVITHRLHTLEIADRIVVLDEGRVIAVGTHQELMARCAMYQRLHEAHGQKLVA